MAQEQVPWSLFTRIVGGLGMLIFFAPRLILLVAHRFRPSVPAHVDFLTYALMSCVGLLIALIGSIPTLVRMNRAE